MARRTLTAHDIEPDEFPCGCRGYYEPIDPQDPDRLRLVIRVSPECPFDRDKAGKSIGRSVVYQGPVTSREWTKIWRAFKKRATKHKAKGGGG